MLPKKLNIKQKQKLKLCACFELEFFWKAKTAPLNILKKIYTITTYTNIYDDYIRYNFKFKILYILFRVSTHNTLSRANHSVVVLNSPSYYIYLLL